MKKASL